MIITTGCASLPTDISRPPSYVISDGYDTALDRKFEQTMAEHPGQSSPLLLGNGLETFVGRVLLAQMAERSIDVQYYMYHQDTVGRLLNDQLIKAADRGVRVRPDFNDNIEKVAFRLALVTDEFGNDFLEWHLKKGEEEIVYNEEPYVGFWKKFGTFLIRLLPVEKYLWAPSAPSPV